MWYWLIAGYFRLALWVFFRRIEASGVERVPQDGPILLVSNHSNALVDPFVIMQPLSRRLDLTAKSTLRQNPLLRFVMWGLDVILFHRREDVAPGEVAPSNRSGFEECRERLLAGRAVCIFPEGKSHSEPAMRRFLTGAARIALDYEDQHPEATRLRIVPVGLHYDRKDRFRSTAWVRFGEPLDVRAWRRVHEQGDATELTERIENEVRNLQIDYDGQAEPQVYRFVETLVRGRGLAPTSLGTRETRADRPEKIQNLVTTRRLMRRFEPRRLRLLEERIARFRRKLQFLGIAPNELFLPLRTGRAIFFVLRELELFFVGLPIRAWGEVNHFLPFQLVRWITRRISEDDDQVASNATVLSLPVFPIFYGLQTAVVAGFFGSGAAVLYLLSLPYSGAVALRHRDRSGGAVRRARTFLAFRRSPAIQRRLVGEARELLASISEAEREMEQRAPAWVLDFRDERAEALERSGGKGANLSRTTRLGFPVPAGCVLTAAAYESFAEETITPLGVELAAIGLSDPERSLALAAQIRTLVLETPLPDEIRESIFRQVAPLVEGGAVAVRSSSTQEDLGGAAFAGQHDTFLHVLTMQDLFDKIRRCYASLWEDRAVRYRLERGFRLEEATMAVVVQRMVPAEVAGVAFSVHPVSGSLDQVIVNAAYGLGETVVSGDGAIDQFVLDRNDGEVLESILAEKSFRLVGTDEGGVEEVAVHGAEASAPCLDVDQLRTLSGLAQRAEAAFGFPQDIEWAWSAGEFFLLQSRPVSSIPPRWTRDESAERFPNPITPLTWDFTRDGFHESLAFSLDLMGLPPFEGLWFERFDGYIYGNQNAVELFARGRGVGAELLEDPKALERALAKPYAWARELPVAWMSGLDRYLVALGRVAGQPLREKTEAELWEHVLEIDRVGREYFRPNIAISLTQGALHRLLYTLVEALVGSDGAAELHDDLTCFCETKTALVNRELLRLSSTASASGALAELLRREESRALWDSGQLQVFDPFWPAFQRFLEDHGHREIEFDAYVPTWSGQPWVVLDHLRLLVDRVATEPEDRVELRARNRQHRAEVRLLALVPEALRFLVGEVLRLTRVYTALDDIEHYETTRLSVPFRAALVELGDRFLELGALERAEDVFFLQRSEVEGFLAGEIEAGSVATLSAERRTEHDRQWRTSPPLVLGEEPRIAGAGDLAGIAGSPGTAEGPVFRVFSADDFARFPPGAVLVARTTNPAWTPLFYSAAAVITESGGPLSHGAVTARELGLPAVMALPAALSLFEDGERVRVHGGAGVVERLDGARRIGL